VTNHTCSQNPAQVLGDAVGVSAVLAAMLGLSILLLTGVLTWKECLEYAAAWDTLFWFAVLVGEPPAGTVKWHTGGCPSRLVSAPVSSVRTVCHHYPRRR